MKFTYSEYQAFLETLRSRNYRFARFAEAQKLLTGGSPFVLLRHDVDFDLKKAERLARIEAEMGIKATYFFLILTEHYNLFSEAGALLVKSILQHGHYFGLHFDGAAYPKDFSVHQFRNVCHKEIQLLETWFDKKVEAVSFHRPCPDFLAGDPRLTEPLPHAYMDVFTKQIFYCSDSRGMWRYGSPLESEAFKTGKPMHLLFHPVWWSETEQESAATLNHLFDDKLASLDSSFARNCQTYQPRTLGDGI
jgi:hypothetical protein